MGFCGSTKRVAPVGNNVTKKEDSHDIDQQLKNDQLQETKVNKLLVLGTGESGKSTVFKQMKLLYSDPKTTEKHRIAAVHAVRANVVQNAHQLLKGAAKLGIHVRAKSAAQIVLDLIPSSSPVAEHADLVIDAFATLWADPAVVTIMEEHHTQLALHDSTAYFWESAARVLRPDYVPTPEDLLRVRVRTTGIVSQDFVIDGKRYSMFDVGGQRNERRKWIHCFDSVTAVIFVVAASEYDKLLREDGETNRMDEALTLFEQIVNHSSFRDKSVILFLNKTDLLEEKLKRVPLSNWDSSYRGGCDVDSAVAHLHSRFLSMCHDDQEAHGRKVYMHSTCATDTHSMRFVMQAVLDIVLKENLRSMGEARLNATRCMGDDDDKVHESVEQGGGGGVPKKKKEDQPTTATFPARYSPNTVLLCACHFTDRLDDRSVAVLAANHAHLPAAELPGACEVLDEEWAWALSLGVDVPPDDQLPPPSASDFRGRFSAAVKSLRLGLGIGAQGSLGTLYDRPIRCSHSGVTLLICVRRLKTRTRFPLAASVGKDKKTSTLIAWENHEAFERSVYKQLDNVVAPCDEPSLELPDPFAPHPVGHRWFRGITLFVRAATAVPTRGVYLGLLRLVSTTQGMKVMVNEHNRVMVPHLLLSGLPLSQDEAHWLRGVRVRWERGYSLLQDESPNLTWLGPEVTGDDGASFPQKFWWAIHELRQRLGLPAKSGSNNESQGLGTLYDAETVLVDEADNVELVVLGQLVHDESELLPGHVWLPREEFEMHVLKYHAPRCLQSFLAKQREIVQLQAEATAHSAEAMTIDQAEELQAHKINLAAQMKALLDQQRPIKWVDRLILWCASNCPSFTEHVPSRSQLEADELVSRAYALDSEVVELRAKRRALIDAICQDHN